MKTIHFALALLMALLVTGCYETKSPVTVQKEILTETRKLEQSIARLRDSVTQSNSPKSIAKQFKAARLQYKKVEWALEYFLPQIIDPSQEMNTDLDYGTHFRPRNFDNLDRMVASDKIAEDKELMLEEINCLLENSKSIQAYLQTMEFQKEEAVAGIE